MASIWRACGGDHKKWVLPKAIYDYRRMTKGGKGSPALEAGTFNTIQNLEAIVPRLIRKSATSYALTYPGKVVVEVQLGLGIKKNTQLQSPQPTPKLPPGPVPRGR